LEGLDATESQVSDLERTKRIDAEFFSKRHLRVAALLRKSTKESIAQVAEVSDGSHFAISDHFVDAGIPYYRGQDAVGHFFIEQCSPFFITEHAYHPVHMRRSHLQRGDVLLSIVGTIGEASLVTSDAPATCSCKLAILRSRSIPSEFLAVFLHSELGRSQTERFTRGAVQMGLLLEDMDQLFVARLSESLEQRIVGAVKQARTEMERAKTELEEAEEALVDALGLGDWQPPEPLTYTRRASEAFAARRLDSQYFAPRVAEFIAHLSTGGRTFRDVAPPRHENFSPSSRGEFRYIEISDVHNDGTASCTTLAMRDAPSRATQFVRAGDVVTSTVRPNRRLSAIVSPEQDGCVASSGFVVLQPTAVPAEVLLTYLRLPLFCELMDLHTSASLYPAISERDLLTLPFPRISKPACDKTVAAVRSAHAARARARELLERAKRAVEIAIEQGEKAALDHLNHLEVAMPKAQSAK
jgi:hypothetical protein